MCFNFKTHLAASAGYIGLGVLAVCISMPLVRSLDSELVATAVFLVMLSAVSCALLGAASHAMAAFGAYRARQALQRARLRPRMPRLQPRASSART